MVHLYILNSSSIAHNLSAALEKLNTQKAAQYSRYIKKNDQLRCIAGGILLTEIINGGNTTYTIQYHTNGKPYIENKSEFNLSHSGDFALLAVADRPVGCDIQKHSAINYEGLAKRRFHPDELHLLKHSREAANTFFNIWALKESYIKQTGQGLSCPINSFSFSFENETIFINSGQKGNDTKYVFQLWNHYAGYSIAVCGENEAICKQVTEIKI